MPLTINQVFSSLYKKALQTSTFFIIVSKSQYSPIKAIIEKQFVDSKGYIWYDWMKDLDSSIAKVNVISRKINLNYSRQYNHFGYTAKECDNLTLDS